MPHRIYLHQAPFHPAYMISPTGLQLYRLVLPAQSNVYSYKYIDYYLFTVLSLEGFFFFYSLFCRNCSQITEIYTLIAS